MVIYGNRWYSHWFIVACALLEHLFQNQLALFDPSLFIVWSTTVNMQDEHYQQCSFIFKNLYSFHGLSSISPQHFHRICLVSSAIVQPWHGHPSATEIRNGCHGTSLRRRQRAGLLPAPGAIGCATWRDPKTGRRPGWTFQMWVSCEYNKVINQP